MEFAERAPIPKIVHIKLGKLYMKLWLHRMQPGNAISLLGAMQLSD